MHAQERFLSRHQMVLPNAGSAPARTLTSDDYPLIEVQPDQTLGGHWLFLHPAPDVPATLATTRFIADGESVLLTCSRMLTSHYTRTTPPPYMGSRSPVTVYTAADHLAR